MDMSHMTELNSGHSIQKMVTNDPILAFWTTQKEYLPCDTTKSNYSNKFPIYFINYPF